MDLLPDLKMPEQTPEYLERKREYEERERERKMEQFFRNVHIPNHLRTCTIPNFDWGKNVKNEKKYQFVRQYYADLADQNAPRPDKGIFFSGDIGVGKTHLAVGLLLKSTSKFSFVRYQGQVELNRSIRKINQYDNTDETYSHCLYSHVLLIDDLGLGTASQSADLVREHMFELIENRQGSGKLTFLTTNLSPEELAACLGQPTMDRIGKICHGIHLTGKSLR